MTRDRRGNFAFLCDFDGTICPTQMMDFLYQRFAACGMEFADRWQRGEISTQEEIVSTFATVRASREEMEAALDTIEIDPHFPVFLEFCRSRDYSFAIVSDGLEWYIDYILTRHDIRGVDIYANQIHFGVGGFRFDFPWYDDETPMRGVCKPRIVRRYQERGRKVVYAGDGMSDFDVIGVADHIFARRKLASFARAQGVEFTDFDDCRDLLEKWRTLSLMG
ncbi:MAG TPA: MtnX-like HAD-IB family phosphatase [Anaerolineae bacterium]|nr:MtnX-like HAD-IB family phosphatase [Anaerolineae bacterium]